MLFPLEQEFKTWVKHQEVRAELKKRLMTSLSENTRKSSKEDFSPFNTVNS
jgi:uncharacterized protein YifE (UPF0438 family)